MIRKVWNRSLHFLAKNMPGAEDLRVTLHRMRGVKINGKVFISSEVYIDDAHPEWVEIGDDVTLGVRSTIIAHFRSIGYVRIKNKVFVGPGSIILPNVEVGEGAVIAAGSVVNKDVPPYTLVGGVPAKPLKKVTHPLGISGSVEEFHNGLRPLE